MSAILRTGARLMAALIICSAAQCLPGGAHAQSWVPTSTPNAERREHPFPTGEALPPSLRALQSSQTRDMSIERIAPLQPEAQDEVGVESVLAEGGALMEQRRWYDAKKVFEKGLRTYPENQELKTRFAEARRRQDIGIRYQDSSFSSLASRTSITDAMAIFDEVLIDIDRYHVDSPKYDELFELGMTGVGEALGEDSFYRANRLPLDRKETALETFALVRDRLQSETFSNRSELERAAVWVARQLKRRAGIGEPAIISEFLCSAICSLDAYSASLTPMQVDDVFSLIDGKFVGIGVELKTDAPTKIVRVIPRSPAEEAGIMVGDELEEIDGTDTEGLTGAEIGELLQGLEGEKSVIRLRTPGGQEREITAIRRAIDVPSVESVRIADRAGAVGYLKITCFQKTTSAELSDALQELEVAGARSLIIDLRQNPGGLLQEAVSVSDLFLDSGMIVQTRGRNGYVAFRAKNAAVCSLPLVLLVDSNSASAAEIFAGAMQENNRATVVGSQSYGKGTVQAIVQLNTTTESKKPIAGVRLTTEKFYSPRGRAYSGVGVLPNVDITDELERQEAALQRRAQTNRAYADSAEPDESEDSVEHYVGYLKRPSRAIRQEQEPVDVFLATGVREAKRLESQNAAKQNGTRLRFADAR